MTHAEFVELVGGKLRGGKGSWRCPGHDDRLASGASAVGDNGAIVVTCHAGCGVEQILAPLGLSVRDLFPPRERSPEETIYYDYVGPDGALRYQAVRLPGKQFRQRRPVGDGWAWTMAAGRFRRDTRGVYVRAEGAERSDDVELPPVAYTLFGAPALVARSAEPLWICEGEKDAIAVGRLGLLATTNVGGAERWRGEYTVQLAGHTGPIYVLPDNDKAGEAHARQVCAALPRAVVVRLPGLKAKGDVSDWISGGGTRDELVALSEAAAQSVPVVAREPVAGVGVGAAAAGRPLQNNDVTTCAFLVENHGAEIFGGKIEWNEMSCCVEIGRRAITDADVTGARVAIGRGWECGGKGMRQSVAELSSAVERYALAHAYHPVREYLSGLAWDGVGRVEELVSRLEAAESSAPLLLRRTLVGAVARAYQPGCKLDTMLILVGAQGGGKSSLFAALAGKEEWFSDGHVDVETRDGSVALRGKWFVELSELSSLRRARDAEATKAFLSRAIEKYRPPYGRHEVTEPRSCLIVGSTNDPDILSDPTGARRFWPVAVGTIDLAWVREHRDQLWAEARAAYEAGEPWWLSVEEEAALTPLRAAAYEQEDTWQGVIHTWLRHPERRGHTAGWTTHEVLAGALSLAAVDQTPAAQQRASAALRRLGLERYRVHSGARRWRSTGSTSSTGSSTAVEPKNTSGHIGLPLSSTGSIGFSTITTGVGGVAEVRGCGVVLGRQEILRYSSGANGVEVRRAESLDKVSSTGILPGGAAVEPPAEIGPDDWEDEFHGRGYRQ